MNPQLGTQAPEAGYRTAINTAWDGEVDPDLLTSDARDLGPIPLPIIQRALRIIDASGVVEMVKQWRTADTKYRGGRPRLISDRAILALWLIAAMEGHPMQIKVIGHMVDSRLSEEGAQLLGVQFRNDPAGAATFHQVDRATEAVIDLIDAFPIFNRSRKLSLEELTQVYAERAADPDRFAELNRRAAQFRGALLWATYELLPNRYLTERVSLAIDATHTKAWARGIGKKRLAELAAHAKVSIEPDFGFYARQTEHHGEPNSGRIKHASFGLEVEFAVLLSNDPDQPNAVPHIALGMATHRPGEESAKGALQVLQDIAARGSALHHIVSDRLYMPGSVPEEFQNVLRNMGAKLVMDYKKNQLGNQAEQRGALLIDGTFYCPGMPKAFQQHFANTQAERDGEDQNTQLSLAERDEQQIQLRSLFELRPKERPDERGYQPMMCPAAGPNPTVSCPLKPRADQATKSPLYPILDPPKHPGKICRNKSSTSFHINDGGKTRQEYQYRGPDWTKWYGQRNVVEGFNAYMKSSAGGDIATADRRRMRGRAQQEFLITMSTVAANIQKIQDFLQDETVRMIESETRRAPEAKTRSGRHARKTLAFKGRISSGSKIAHQR